MAPKPIRPSTDDNPGIRLSRVTSMCSWTSSNASPNFSLAAARKLISGSAGAELRAETMGAPLFLRRSAAARAASRALSTVSRARSSRLTDLSPLSPERSLGRSPKRSRSARWPRSLRSARSLRSPRSFRSKRSAPGAPLWESPSRPKSERASAGRPRSWRPPSGRSARSPRSERSPSDLKVTSGRPVPAARAPSMRWPIPSRPLPASPRVGSERGLG